MTKDMRFLVECLTRDLLLLCIETYGWDTQRALDTLYASDTFRLLEDERSGLYYQSPAYLFDCLNNELATHPIITHAPKTR